MGKKIAAERRLAQMCECLEDLLNAAHRVDYKYGHDDDDTPLDWDEWREVRRQIMRAKHLLAREGVRV